MEVISGLTNADADGRVILDTAALTLKFVLLNAAVQFLKVTHEGGKVYQRELWMTVLCAEPFRLSALM